MPHHRSLQNNAGSLDHQDDRQRCKASPHTWLLLDPPTVPQAGSHATAARPLHCPVMRWERVPGVAGMHCGTWQVPVGSPLQYLLNQQVLYRPLAILNWTVAFLHSSWEAEQDVRIGEGEERDMWERRRWAREGSSSPAARSFEIQYALTWRVTALFHSYFDGAFWRTCIGSGRPYCWQRFLTCRNQIFEAVRAGCGGFVRMWIP